MPNFDFRPRLTGNDTIDEGFRQAFDYIYQLRNQPAAPAGNNAAITPAAAQAVATALGGGGGGAPSANLPFSFVFPLSVGNNTTNPIYLFADFTPSQAIMVATGATSNNNGVSAVVEYASNANNNSWVAVAANFTLGKNVNQGTLVKSFLISPWSANGVVRGRMLNTSDATGVAIFIE